MDMIKPPRPYDGFRWYSRLNDTHLRYALRSAIFAATASSDLTLVHMFRRHVIDGWDQDIGE